MHEPSNRPACRVARRTTGARSCLARLAWTVFTIWLLSACTPADERGGHLRLIDPQPQWEGDTLGLVAGIDFNPGPAVVEALNHGVTVHIRVAIQVRRPWEFIVNDDLVRNHRFEIRYLPLIRHYELTDLKTGEQLSFPRLSMVLERLQRPQWMDTRFTADEHRDRRWRMQARVDIDRTRLPSPMRLPVWFDRNWSLTEPWHRWDVEARPDSA